MSRSEVMRTVRLSMSVGALCGPLYEMCQSDRYATGLDRIEYPTGRMNAKTLSRLTFDRTVVVFRAENSFTLLSLAFLWLLGSIG